MAFFIPAEYRSFLPRFYRLSLIGILSNMMIPLASLVDAAFLGHLENIDYLAGVILGGILFDYLYRILKFLRSTTTSLTANAVGRGDDAAVLAAILQCGLVALAIAGGMLLLQYPIHKFGFMLLSGSSDIEVAGLEYFNARIWGAPAVLLNFVILGSFLGREMNWLVFLMSLVGNGSNVLFDYLMISRWGWESMGAGLATAMSQYLALGIGLGAIAYTTDWQFLRAAWQKAKDREGFTAAMTFKGNLLGRYFIVISAYSIFTNLSASFGAETLAENGLLLQIALLSQFTVQGIGMTAQTLIGNFKGKGETQRILAVLKLALGSALLVALGFALVTVLCPHWIFQILTNHADVTQAMGRYSTWLVPLLSLTAAVFMLESYFAGVKDGVTLRNGAVLGFFVGFMPLIGLAIQQRSESLLWGALTAYMAVVLVFLTYQLIYQHGDLLFLGGEKSGKSSLGGRRSPQKNQV